MTTGERIRRARQAAGLSQRQLAGEAMTRNMLSLLENDQANPSLETLRYLSRQLERPISYFLGEDAAHMPGLPQLLQARQALAQRRFSDCLNLVGQIPDGDVLEPEREMLWAQAALSEAEQALSDGRERMAQILLENAGKRMERLPYAAAELCARWQVLLARAAQSPQSLAEAVKKLPDVDEILMLRAKAALQREDAEEAERTLEAVHSRSGMWTVLRGDAYFARESYDQALKCYQQAEAEYPALVRRGLQLCYAKLGDFENAYRYAIMD